VTEPLFFDCLTDAQCWSLFDAGVLQSCRVPLEVYERLERMAPDYGCFLFTWPAALESPALRDILPSVALPVEERGTPPHTGLETPVTAEQMRLGIAALGESLNARRPPAVGRIHVITIRPRLELLAGPYLELRAHDLNAMSLPELEAYLDKVLRLDEDVAGKAATASHKGDSESHADPQDPRPAPRDAR
jgi:hypothetical protein